MRILGSADRMDCDGRRIRLSEYGQKTHHGWEIDAGPKAIGGANVTGDLQARHWIGVRSVRGVLPAVCVSRPVTVKKLTGAVLLALDLARYGGSIEAA